MPSAIPLPFYGANLVEFYLLRYLLTVSSTVFSTVLKYNSTECSTLLSTSHVPREIVRPDPIVPASNDVDVDVNA